jgi:hypothetical protein
MRALTLVVHERKIVEIHVVQMDSEATLHGASSSRDLVAPAEPD